MRITGAESTIMEALWRAGRPMAVEDLREALTEEAWTDPTIRTLLGRLADKGAVTASKQGRRFLFTPVIDRADYVHAESKGLIDRLFKGQIEPFVAHFSEREALSEDDIARLRALIERLDRGK